MGTCTYFNVRECACLYFILKIKKDITAPTSTFINMLS